MRNIPIKRILWIILFVSILVFSVLTFFKISRPQLEVFVTGDHNPIDNMVYLDAKLLYPSGLNGVYYKTSAGAGSPEVILRGPFIKTSETTVSMTLFGDAKVEISIDKNTPENIARGVINDASAEIAEIRVFDKTVVFRVFNAGVLDSEGDDSYPAVIVYDLESNNWIRLGNENISRAGGIKISEAAAEYFYGLENE